MIKRKRLNDKVSIFILPLKESEEEAEIILRYIRKTSKNIILLNRDTKESLMKDYSDIINQINFIETREKVLIMLKENYIKHVSFELSQSILNIIQSLKQPERILNNVTDMSKEFVWRKPKMKKSWEEIQKEKIVVKKKRLYLRLYDRYIEYVKRNLK